MEWPWDSGTTSLASLLALVIISIVTGLLIPLRSHNREVNLWKTRAEDYKSAWEKADQRADSLGDTVKQLLGYAATADRILRALPNAAPGRGDDS